MKLFELFSVGLLLSLAIHTIIMFFLAFFNGDKVLMTINDYGEKWIEAVLFPIFIVMGTVTLIRIARRTTARMCPRCMENKRQVPMSKEGPFWCCSVPGCGYKEPIERKRARHYTLRRRSG